jgi:putative phosphoesterase
MFLGVISDTHGLLRPEALRVFKGADLIFHAGDIGSPDVLRELRTVAPVVAVRGNNDKSDWANEIPETQLVEIGGVSFYLLHDLKQLQRMPPKGKVQVVISGHSHKPSIERRDGILFVNPGSAGPKRFTLPIAVARLTTVGSDVSAELVELPALTNISQDDRNHRKKKRRGRKG